MVDEDSILNANNLNDVSYLFNYASQSRFGELHVKMDEETGLHAIIAIHNTKLGPALGGCRCIEYPSVGAGIVDALRLARGMSYKAAIAGLPLGGGKAVLIKPKEIKDRDAYFSKFGEFVDELGGKYITAKDSGSHMNDMDTIAKKTRYVTTTTQPGEQLGDPSYFTARGVFRSIQAGVHYRLKTDSLKGVHVAIQGAGAVAHYVAKDLIAEGARITVCDINAENAKSLADKYGANIVSPDEIYDVECDVFSPSALGATINSDTIKRINTKVIAGCANNQLEKRQTGIELRKRNILYTPDYLANSGGLIYACASYTNCNTEGVEKKIDEIYDTMLMIFARADEENSASNEITSKIVEEMIY